MAIELMRDTRPEPNKVFLAAGFGRTPLPNGEEFDNDAFYTGVICPTCASIGLEVLRADELYGKGDLTETAWHGIQLASLVIVDFSARSGNVAAEFAIALLLRKRIVVLAQSEDDIPSDVRGHYRYIQYDGSWQAMERLKQELLRELPAAMEQPATEMILVPMSTGGTTPVPGEVIVATTDFVIVSTDDRRRVVLNAADVDPRRIIPDMAKRFPVGSRVEGWIEVDLAGDARYTIVPGQQNPWPALESEFPPGTEFRSRVDSVVAGLGAFVHVRHGVNGLVPENRLLGRQVTAGDHVEVAVTTLDLERRRIGLRLDRVLSDVSTPKSGKPRVETKSPTGSSDGKSGHLPNVGDRLVGTVTRAVPEGDGSGGFVLLQVPSLSRPVLLHVTSMTDDMRADLKNGFVEIGEEVVIEVVKVDARRRKVLVKDLREDEEDKLPLAS